MSINNKMIAVLSPAPNTPNGLAFISPLVNWRKKLAERGFKLNFFQKIDKRFYDNNICLIDSKYHRLMWRSNIKNVIKEFETFYKKI